jgi:hypothetical protein
MDISGNTRIPRELRNGEKLIFYVVLQYVCSFGTYKRKLLTLLRKATLLRKQPAAPRKQPALLRKQPTLHRKQPTLYRKQPILLGSGCRQLELLLLPPLPCSLPPGWSSEEG